MRSGDAARRHVESSQSVRELRAMALMAIDVAEDLGAQSSTLARALGSMIVKHTCPASAGCLTCRRARKALADWQGSTAAAHDDCDGNEPDDGPRAA
jgi:hypothetical protein